MAFRSCEDCKRYVYDPRTGEQMKRRGLPVLRPAAVPTPCGACPKIPAGAAKVPESAVELSAENWLAYEHYCECRAVGRFPNDAIVRRNAVVIRAEEDAWGRHEWREMAAAALISRR